MEDEEWDGCKEGGEEKWMRNVGGIDVKKGKRDRV